MSNDDDSDYSDRSTSDRGEDDEAGANSAKRRKKKPQKKCDTVPGISKVVLNNEVIKRILKEKGVADETGGWTTWHNALRPIRGVQLCSTQRKSEQIQIILSLSDLFAVIAFTPCGILAC